MVESPGTSGGVLNARELKALEGLTGKEAQMLISALVDDLTACGIGEMLRVQEADKQVSRGRGASWCVQGLIGGVVSVPVSLIGRARIEGVVVRRKAVSVVVVVDREYRLR